jgi:hypothetical protein
LCPTISQTFSAVAFIVTSFENFIVNVFKCYY